MSIHSILSEVNQLCSLSNIEVIKITATKETTRIQTHDADKVLFIDSELIPMGVEGEFGIMNLKMLGGLLKIRPEETTVTARMRKIDGEDHIDQFEFRNGKMKSNYRLMANMHIPKQATIGKIPWDVEISDLGIFEDFTSFAGIYSEVDRNFSFAIRDDSLVCLFGQEGGSMQSGMLILGKVLGSIENNLTFPVDKVNMLLKLAKGRASKIFITQKSNGMLGMEIETGLGLHRYYLRQVVQ